MLQKIFSREKINPPHVNHTQSQPQPRNKNPTNANNTPPPHQPTSNSKTRNLTEHFKAVRAQSNKSLKPEIDRITSLLELLEMKVKNKELQYEEPKAPTVFNSLLRNSFNLMKVTEQLRCESCT